MDKCTMSLTFTPSPSTAYTRVWIQKQVDYNRVTLIPNICRGDDVILPSKCAFPSIADHRSLIHLLSNVLDRFNSGKWFFVCYCCCCFFFIIVIKYLVIKKQLMHIVCVSPAFQAIIPKSGCRPIDSGDPPLRTFCLVCIKTRFVHSIRSFATIKAIKDVFVWLCICAHSTQAINTDQLPPCKRSCRYCVTPAAGWSINVVATMPIVLGIVQRHMQKGKQNGKLQPRYHRPTVLCYIRRFAFAHCC